VLNFLSILLQKSERYTHTHVEKWRSRKPLSVSVSLSRFYRCSARERRFFSISCAHFFAQRRHEGVVSRRGKRAGEVFGDDASFFVAVSPSLKAIIFVLPIYFSLSRARASLFVDVGVSVQVSF